MKEEPRDPSDVRHATSGAAEVAAMPPMPADLDEKQAIEWWTLAYFLPHLNSETGAGYVFDSRGDSPDFSLRARDGRRIGVEVTLADDREGDIAFLLMRREDRDSTPQNSADEPLSRLVQAVRKKARKDYGESTALVVRQVSPVEWDFAAHVDKISALVGHLSRVYSEGVWVVSSRGESCVRIC